MVKTEGIEVNGHIGTWYVISENIWHGKKVYLLESEQYGEDAAAIIVDAELNIILDDVFNGFDDLKEAE